MPNESNQLHRRDFLRHGTVATATAATFYSAAMTTDALAQQPLGALMQGGSETSNYHYGDS